MKELPESAKAKVEKYGAVNICAGSGTDPKIGYINYDIRPDVPEVDIVDDLRNINEYFEDKTVSNVICFQVLEHFRRDEWREVLSKLCRLLKPGGRIHLRVPSVEDLVDEYQRKHINAEQMFLVIYGMQESFGEGKETLDYHKCGMTIGTLKTELERGGCFVEEVNHVYGVGLLHVVALKK